MCSIEKILTLLGEQHWNRDPEQSRGRVRTGTWLRSSKQRCTRNTSFGTLNGIWKWESSWVFLRKTFGKVSIYSPEMEDESDDFWNVTRQMGYRQDQHEHGCKQNYLGVVRNAWLYPLWSVKSSFCISRQSHSYSRICHTPCQSQQSPQGCFAAWRGWNTKIRINELWIRTQRKRNHAGKKAGKQLWEWLQPSNITQFPEETTFPGGERNVCVLCIQSIFSHCTWSTRNTIINILSLKFRTFRITQIMWKTNCNARPEKTKRKQRETEAIFLEDGFGHFSENLWSGVDTESKCDYKRVTTCEYHSNWMILNEYRLNCMWIQKKSYWNWGML